ncbi:MAG: hypothetical protein ACLVD1_12465 [Lacrimispora saccharolytica]
MKETPGSSNSFMDILEKETNYICSQRTLIEFLTKLPPCTANETARKKIIYFGKTMFYSTGYHINPVFAFNSQLEQIYEKDLIFIHELMQQFLNTKEYMLLPKHSAFNSEWKNSEIKWHVPYRFLPILSAYILSITPEKKGKLLSASKFIKRFNENLDEANEIYGQLQEFEIVSHWKVLEEWINNFLGFQYFSTLQTIYQTYSKTIEQRESLRCSIIELTRIFLECPDNSSIVTTYIHQLLLAFKKDLDDRFHSASCEIKKYDILFGTEKPYSIPEELSTVLRLFQNLFNDTEKFLSFISCYLRKHHIETSPYELAIDNLEPLNQRLEEFRSKINLELPSFSSELTEFFTNFHEQSKEPGNISLSKWNISAQQSHISYFSGLVEDHVKKLQKLFVKFYKNIEHASGPHPERYKTLTIETNYFSNLQNDIARLKKNLYKKVQTSFSCLPSIACVNSPGYLTTHWNKPFYSLDNISQLLHILATENDYHLPDDDIIQYLKKKKIIPQEITGMNRIQFIWLLQNLEILLD